TSAATITTRPSPSPDRSAQGPSTRSNAPSMRSLRAARIATAGSSAMASRATAPSTAAPAARRCPASAGPRTGCSRERIVDQYQRPERDALGGPAFGGLAQHLDREVEAFLVGLLPAFGVDQHQQV